MAVPFGWYAVSRSFRLDGESVGERIGSWLAIRPPPFDRQTTCFNVLPAAAVLQTGTTRTPSNRRLLWLAKVSRSLNCSS